MPTKTGSPTQRQVDSTYLSALIQDKGGGLYWFEIPSRIFENYRFRNPAAPQVQVSAVVPGTGQRITSWIPLSSFDEARQKQAALLQPRSATGNVEPPGMKDPAPLATDVPPDFPPITIQPPPDPVDPPVPTGTGDSGGTGSGESGSGGGVLPFLDDFFEGFSANADPTRSPTSPLYSPPTSRPAPMRAGRSSAMPLLLFAAAAGGLIWWVSQEPTRVVAPPPGPNVGEAR